MFFILLLDYLNVSKESNVDDFFDTLLSRGNDIFTDRKVLRHTWIPDKPLHRDREWKELGAILGTSLRGGTPSNLLLYGSTGTGKTMVSLYVLTSLERKVKEITNKTFSYSFINCNQLDTKYRVFWHLCNDSGIEVPFTGLAFDVVYNKFLEAIDKRGGLHVVVLDEVDVLYTKSKDTLYLLTRINNQLQNASVSLVCISNNTQFKENLDPRIKSSLGEEELTFKPYNASQLQDILLERAKRALNMEALAPEVIPYCAAKGAQQHGDARRAIELLRVSAELAERQGDPQVTEKHVDQAEAQIERKTVEEIIDSLPIQTKTVLVSCYILDQGPRSEVYSGDVYNMYSTIAKRLRIEVLTSRRVSDLLNELDMLGMIDAFLMSKGRHGRTKRITLSITPIQVRNALASDGRFDELLSISAE